MTRAEAMRDRLSIWAWTGGWTKGKHDCFYNPSVGNGKEVRLNLRDREVARLQKKVLLVGKEKRQNPNKNTKWTTLKEQAYTKISLTGRGLDFGKATKKKTKSTSAKKAGVAQKKEY